MIFDLTTQDGQMACFQNAAAHLPPWWPVRYRGRGVSELRRLPFGQTALPWRGSQRHVVLRL
jgi:hypothetical protein